MVSGSSPRLYCSSAGAHLLGDNQRSPSSVQWLGLRKPPWQPVSAADLLAVEQ